MQSLDVTKNLALTSLACNNNELITLDVANNTSLVKFYCSDNKLTRINITANTALKELDVADNLLSVLNIRNNAALTYLCVSNNADIAMVDVKLNTALEVLVASGLAITDVDLTANTALKGVELFNENLTTSNIPATTRIGYVFERKTPYSKGKMMSVNVTSGKWSEAKTWCTSFTGWYLPSIDELSQIYNNKSVIDSVLSAYGYATLYNESYEFYWSSTDGKYGGRRRMSFWDGETDEGNMSTHNLVRAVLAW